MTEPTNQVPPAMPLPPPKEDSRRLEVWFLGIIAFAVILFLLVQAKFLLISLAIAIMLFSLTSDAISYIQRLRFGEAKASVWFASLLAVILIATVLISVSVLILSQANTVVFTVMQYADPAQKALATLFSWMGADVEQAVLNWLKGVQIGPWLAAMAGQAGNIASGAVLVTLFVGFLFLERLWFRPKLVSLMGDAESALRVERIISSIVHRVNRYLIVKTVVSLVTGALVYLVMSAFGLELAMAMGVLTFVLNFIPNIGSILATIAVGLVAYVQTGDAVSGIAVLTIVVAIQFVVGQVLDPLFLGRTLRLSSFGIIASLAFWAAVWGIPGMFLAVPIMVSIMIVCSHIPRLRPVAVLLSREGLPEVDIDQPHQTPVTDAA
ncbi:Predicted PurR-regulated permease PerM [Gemmobacter megaterium]|uniref:Predicted PurR-regulated permease PerM n=1 Tax=Gemmobacter megaterium TaxID=1086013 RepID=A0A1N7P137_9RHOB|nr:AI-2E family transporter [Gemmobacter megaterium]GGE15217.1 AI-2E family transporter [Gemmobacter megaterium]SIT04292.1 Predicted PurR-regulated permease PerM [Gemmobacter megaterium]